MKNINQLSRIILTSLLLVPALSYVCSGQHQTNPNAFLPLDKQVLTGRLANGFTYYLRRNTEPKNRVVMYLANKAGSILESPEQLGLAHFLEHMNFNGTTHYPKNQLVDYLEKSGVRFGADINAYTSFDETVYQLPLPSDDPQVVKNGLQIMRDWAQEAMLEESEIEKERGVVLEEKRLRKGVGERLQRQYYPFLLNGSRYAERLPIGSEQVIKTFRPETIRSFYKDWYRPNLQALIIVGDVDMVSMEKEIRSKFGDLRNPLKEKPRTVYHAELTGKNRFMALSDDELTAVSAQVVIKSQASVLQTAADYRKAIIRALFNQMLSQRYRELMQLPDAPLQQGSAGMSEFMAGLSAYTATMVAKPGQDGLEKAFKAVWRETMRVEKLGFTSAELRRVKSNYAVSMDAAYKEASKIPSESYVKEYLDHFLKGSASPGIAFEQQFVQTQLRGISLDELNSTAKLFIKNTDRDILVMGPSRDKVFLPDEATVNKWLSELEEETLQPYSEVRNEKPLLMHAPVKGKILKEEKNALLGITTLSMSNGVKVVLKPTTFRNNQVLLRGSAPGGTNLYGDKDFQSAANAATIIGSFGAGNYSNTELSKFLTGKQLGVRTGMSETSQQVAGSSSSVDLKAMLELLYAYFTEPRKDSTQFTGIISRSKASLANRGDDPASVFQDTSAAVLGGYHVRKTGPTVQKIEQISLDRSFEIYKERFGDASGYTFTMVGSFLPDSIKGMLETYLGGLPASGSAAGIKDLGLHIPGGKISKTVYKGSEPKASVQLLFSGSFDFNDKNMIALEALKDALSFRLLERLREEEGGVYSPSASVGFSKLPAARYTFSVSFGCSPQNVEKLIASALEEIQQLKSAGPPQANVDKLIAESLRQRESYIQSNDFWLQYISGTLQVGEELTSPEGYNAILKALTPEALKTTARRYLGGENYIRLVLMPEKAQ